MGTTISFTKELSGDKILLTGKVTSDEIPGSVFLYKLLETGFPGEFQGLVNLDEFQKYLEFTGKPLSYKGPVTGFCRRAKLEVTIPNGIDPDDVQNRIIRGLKSFKETYLATRTTTKTVII